MKEETGFWLFNCNPAIWDIKSKLETDETNEDWRIPKNRIHQFKKGQLGIIRVAIDTRSKNTVFVSRIRRDRSQKNSFNMWVIADPLRKGAATNAVQILEKIINNNK